MPILSQILGPNGSGTHQQVLSIVISHVPSDRVGEICFSIKITGSLFCDTSTSRSSLGPRCLSSPPRSLIISSVAL